MTYLPQLLIASGLERLLKCYFCLVHKESNGRYPDTQFLKKLGHDLQKLKQTFIDDYYSTNDKLLLIEDLEYIRTDLHLDRIIHVLSEFGQKARYYNLDIITGSQQPPIDTKKEWEDISSVR